MYPSKILLFGEYSILLNSFALAIPYGKFKGGWDFIKNRADNPAQANESNQSLRLFLNHLRLLESEKNIDLRLDVSRLKDDVENGLYFKSDIPIGAGLGSSGALVAAIFDKYVDESAKSKTVSILKKSLAFLESYFHGTSSGIDPLVSYLNSPILVKGNNEFDKISFPITKTLQKLGLFLVDSGQKGNTGNLVDYFNQKCGSDNEYLDRLKNQYIPLNNECITKIVEEGDEKHFFSLIRDLSSLQLILFEKMIPRNIAHHMNYGIKNNLFYLKLCGSGGGFFLGFTENVANTKDYFNNAGCEILIF
ncbi:MAG TPA: mevalonate kinase [Bacteroidales bacterium]|nr:mevalonate kinase [Bacteroidales bacterium]